MISEGCSRNSGDSSVAVNLTASSSVTPDAGAAGDPETPTPQPFVLRAPPNFLVPDQVRDGT